MAYRENDTKNGPRSGLKQPLREKRKSGKREDLKQREKL